MMFDYLTASVFVSVDVCLFVCIPHKCSTDFFFFFIVVCALSVLALDLFPSLCLYKYSCMVWVNGKCLNEMWVNSVCLCMVWGKDVFDCMNDMILNIVWVTVLLIVMNNNVFLKVLWVNDVVLNRVWMNAEYVKNSVFLDIVWVDDRVFNVVWVNDVFFWM